MKINLSKKKFVIIISLFSFFLIGASIYLLVINYSPEKTVLSDRIGVADYSSFCSFVGCLSNDEVTKSVFTGVISEVQLNEGDGEVTVSMDVWNSLTNEIKPGYLFQIKVEAIENKEEFLSYSFPRNFKVEITLEKFIIPKFRFTEKGGILFYTHEASNIKFVDLQADYLGKGFASNQEFDSESLKKAISRSLQQEERFFQDPEGGEWVSIVNKYILNKGEISLGQFQYAIGEAEDCSNFQDKYQKISLWELAGIAEKKPAEELKYNCRILKKYYPEEECMDPYLEMKTEIEELLRTLKIPDVGEQDAPISRGSIIGDSVLVSEARNDLQNWANLNLGRIWDIRISTNINILVEYLYYSNLSCGDEVARGMCQDIDTLYRYLKEREGLGFCGRRTFLPLLSVVSKDEKIKDDLKYILEQYPFQKECTLTGGGEGYCSVDLSERISCMGLLSDSMLYYEDNPGVEETIRVLLLDTLALYLEENDSKVGLWGRDEINIISGFQVEESLYPVRYYDIQENGILYKVLDSLY